MRIEKTSGGPESAGRSCNICGKMCREWYLVSIRAGAVQGNVNRQRKAWETDLCFCDDCLSRSANFRGHTNLMTMARV